MKLSMKLSMKQISTIFLQVVVIFIGIGTLAFLLWEPHVEGRNVHATLFEIYFKDPFLAYAYLGSTPFFATLYQTFKLIGYARQDRAISSTAVSAVRMIRYCAVAIVCFVAVGEIFILTSNSDDHAPGVAMGVVISFGSIVIAAVAVVLEGVLQRALTWLPTTEKSTPGV
ncbi:MAG: hypothetical protein RIR52_2264 [Acidobacteriota bacterium]|jgi:hypothetical protein